MEFPKYDRPFFFHYRDEVKNSNGITVCALPAGEQTFVVSTAKCSLADIYSKKKGRAIAEGRAQKRKRAFVVRASDIDELRLCAHAIATHIDSPQFKVNYESA